MVPAAGRGDMACTAFAAMLGKVGGDTRIVALGYWSFLPDMELLLHPLRSRAIRQMEALRKRPQAAGSDLERFVSEQNVALYRKMLGESKDETQRLTIAKLLADEVAKLRNR